MLKRVQFNRQSSLHNQQQLHSHRPATCRLRHSTLSTKATARADVARVLARYASLRGGCEIAGGAGAPGFLIRLCSAVAVGMCRLRGPLGFADSVSDNKVVRRCIERILFGTRIQLWPIEFNRLSGGKGCE